MPGGGFGHIAVVIGDADIPLSLIMNLNNVVATLHEFSGIFTEITVWVGKLRIVSDEFSLFEVRRVHEEWTPLVYGSIPGVGSVQFLA